MTYFAQQLLKAVKPNTKLEQHVRITRITVSYDQASFEKKMAMQRGGLGARYLRVLGGNR